MIALLKNAFNAWRGAGDHAITVPPMDGALSPNQVIEEAPVVLNIAAPDNLVSLSGRILFSSGAEVHELHLGAETASSSVVMQFDHPVTALAASAGGALAIGLDDGSLRVVGGKHHGLQKQDVAKQAIRCPAALQFLDEDTLLMALGSRTNPRSAWKRDLMQRNASGSVWRLNLAAKRDDCLADSLGFPSGLAVTAAGDVIVSEAWNNQIVKLAAKGKHTVELPDVTGYPGAMSPAAGGGYWLAVFAPRSQLIEFVLRERDFRACMLDEVEEALWISPTLEPAQTFLEPLQGGALKHLGILKPWAPTRSFGLVVRLDAGFQPLFSMHSRADGRRHGITSCLEAGGRLLTASRGGNVIVSLPTVDPNGV